MKLTNFLCRMCRQLYKRRIFTWFQFNEEMYRWLLPANKRLNHYLLLSFCIALLTLSKITLPNAPSQLLKRIMLLSTNCWTKCLIMDSRWPPRVTFLKNSLNHRISYEHWLTLWLGNQSMYFVICEYFILHNTISFQSGLIVLVVSFWISVSGTLPSGQLSAIPWRRSSVKYTNNEAYFDVIEEVDASTYWWFIHSR